MVFVQFSILQPFHTTTDFFVGTTLEAILADTKGGTRFGVATYTRHKVVSEAEVRLLEFEYLDSSIEGVLSNRGESYWIGSK